MPKTTTRAALDYVYPQIVPAVRVNMGPSAWYFVGAFNQNITDGPDRQVGAVALRRDADPNSWEVDTAVQGLMYRVDEMKEVQKELWAHIVEPTAVTVALFLVLPRHVDHHICSAPSITPN